MPGRVQFYKVRRGAGACIAVLALLAVTLYGLDRAFPPDLARLSQVSAVVEGENARPLRVFSTADGLLRLRTNVADIDPTYIRFLKSYEDRRFDHHIGVDPAALMRAMWQWGRAGHVVSGAGCHRHRESCLW